MIGLYCFLVFVFFLASVILITYWRFQSYDYPKIKYGNFRKYYAMNPDKWYCGHSFVSYRLSNGDSEEFCFRLFGFYLYRLRNYLIKVARRRKEDAEAVQRMLDDINKTEAENDSQ